MTTFGPTLTNPDGLAFASVVLIVWVTAFWLVSVKARDASLVDRIWGLNFVVLSAAYAIKADEVSSQGWLALALVVAWGLRLSLHITLRNRGHGEDWRYQEMRRKSGKSFWLKSYASVFLLQGALSILISAPLLFVISSPSRPLTATDAWGLALWCIGIYFEVVGDLQLKRFRANPRNAGKVLDTGLWGLTRHPNYFGDGMIWCGFYVLALGTPGGWITAFAPLVMVFFLRYVSGVTLLEKTLIKTKPGYKAYAASTPAFIPNLYLGAMFRFLLLCSIKWASMAFFRFRVDRPRPISRDDWKDVRLAVLLNHTTLFEPIICGVLPYSYIWRLASRGIFPGAAETLSRPVIGRILKALAPKVLPISRKRDDTWIGFLDSLSLRDTMIFMPEGRMKRPTGLDKNGNPMTLRGGIVDVLDHMRRGKMLVCVSGGLHHVHAPGDGFPRLFKTIALELEVVDIESYLAVFQGEGRRDALLQDLTQRRDRFLDGIEATSTSQ